MTKKGDVVPFKGWADNIYIGADASCIPQKNFFIGYATGISGNFNLMLPLATSSSDDVVVSPEQIWDGYLKEKP